MSITVLHKDTFKCSSMTDIEQTIILADCKKINVLYLDDEEANLFIFRMVFGKIFNVFLASDYDSVVSIILNNDINVFITDQMMPTITGSEVLLKLKEHFFDTQLKQLPTFMLLTAFVSPELLLTAINDLHIFKYLQKPFNIEEIKNAIYEAYAKRKR